LAAKGIKIGLFSFNKSAYKWYDNNNNIQLLFEPDSIIQGSGIKEKISYFKYLPILKTKIKAFQPDVLHAHYATSYGFIGALSGFNPFVISVWGSDVFDFPKKNFLNKKILKYALSKATVLCSTSICMKNETELYTNKPISVIPFGIDTDKFNRSEGIYPLQNTSDIVFGNIKPLESKYGIDILIHTFNKIVKKHPAKKITLKLIGEGSERKNYEKLTKDLGINHLVMFLGRIPHQEIVDYHKNIDIFISLSVLDSESFGVSLVEAMSCKSIVIGSNVAGFNEVLGGNSEVGYLVAKNSEDETVKAIEEILKNPDIAIKKGEKARLRVLELYDWKNNILQMIDVYENLMK
jgi:glycosyltransferase involved in cell wall biosynthesis